MPYKYNPSTGALDYYEVNTGGTGPQGPRGLTGLDGSDAFCYTAYASDSSGTGFTTTYNSALDYIAIKSTNTSIASPDASDFTGLWKKYKGEQGAIGPQGVAGQAGPGGPQGPAGPAGQNGASVGTYLISGGSVAWSSGYTYHVAAASYLINGTAYTADASSVTLAAADDEDDRIDAIVLDSSGVLSAVTGDSGGPVQPVVDPLTHCQLTFVYVGAGTTAPQVTLNSIYLENTEWTMNASAGTIVFDSSSSPRTGTKCINGTAVAANAYFYSASASPITTINQWDYLVFYIKLKPTWVSTRAITLQWYSTGTKVGAGVVLKNGSYGLNTANTTTYQQIAVPVSMFGITVGSSVNRLRFTFGGSGGTIGFRIDDITLQQGVYTQSQYAVTYRGAWNATTAYAVDDIVTLGVFSYLAIAPSTNMTPATNTTFWACLGLITLASLTFTGTPSLPTGATGVTQASNTNNTTLATTAYADTKQVYHGIEASGALTFDASHHIVSIAAGTNTYWYQGFRYTTSSAIICDLDSYVSLTTNTLYYVYFDGTAGTLKASADFWNMKTTVPVCTLWWNGSAGAIGKETHNHTRDLDWHIQAHMTIGARYYSGLGLVTPTAADSSSISIGSGTLYDEDLVLTIDPQTTCRIVRLVSEGVYTWTNSALPYPGTSGAPQYLNTSTYNLTAIGSSDYAPMWVYGTTDTERPIYIIPHAGAAAFNTLPLARASTPPSLAGLGVNPEIKLLYRWIFKGDGAFQEYTDYRNSSPVPSGGSASTSAGAVVFNPTGRIAAATVQAAIEELDNEKLDGKEQTLTPANSITINWNLGATATLLLDRASTQLTFSNPVAGNVYRIRLLQDGTGSRVVTYTDTIKWRGGTQPTLTTSINKADWITLVYTSIGWDADANCNF